MTKIFGGISFNEDGISTSLRGMHLQTSLLGTVNENLSNFGQVGYQKKQAVVSSFSEYVGAQALSEVKDTKVGRLRLTKNPLDFAISSEGYFQYQTPQGIKLTRDGRFKLDKKGHLLTLENNKVLSSTGQVIKFKKMPKKLEDIKVDKDGTINVYDNESGQIYSPGQLSIVSNEGSIAKKVDVRQGFTEDSNVTMYQEFFNLIPIRRNFEANRQLYIIQNDELSKTIQELGRSS